MVKFCYVFVRLRRFVMVNEIFPMGYIVMQVRGGVKNRERITTVITTIMIV